MTTDDPFRDAIRRQLGAAIDMLDNAIAACPSGSACMRRSTG